MDQRASGGRPWPLRDRLASDTYQAPLIAGTPIQVGIVVHDVDEALPRDRALFGERDWLVVENGPWNMHNLHIRGDGLYRLGYVVDTIAAMHEQGYACLQHGYGFNADKPSAFVYVDTEAELGYLIQALDLGNH